MRNIPASEILDQVTGAKKKALMQRSIVNPAELVNATGDESWTIDGREELPVSPRLVISILRSHATNNATDGAEDASFANSKGEAVKGNPIIFGNLSTKNVTIMGTDDEPLLVMSASGRQMSKSAEWVTSFLRHARHVMQRAKGDVTKAQGLIMSASGDETTEHVIASFAETDWLLIFKGGSAIGKPLVTVDYSAQCWLKVGYGQGKPTTRRALEDSKRDNIRVPSTFTGEALSLQKLVRSYIFDDGFSEEGALRHARSLVANPIAVGANADPSEAYVEQLYRFGYLCDEARAVVDSELDPIKALSLLAKLTKKLFRAGKHIVERADGSKASWTINKLSEEEQIALLQPKAAKSKEPKTPSSATPKKPRSKTPKPVIGIPTERYGEAARRLSLLAQEFKADDEEAKTQQREIAAVAAFIAYQVQGAKAIKDRPWLANALAALEEDGDKFLELQDLLEAWDGKEPLELRDPECDADGEEDPADVELLRQTAFLLTELEAAMREVPKAQRKAWAMNWLVNKAGGKLS